MNPFIIKYCFILGALAVSHLGVAWIVADYKERGHRAAIAEQKAEAERTLTAVTEANRKKEQADADNARNIDAVYQTLLADAYAGRDAFAERLRIARRGASCSSTPVRETADPGIRAHTPEGRDDGPGGHDSALTLRDAALELQNYAKVCHSWALTVGK